MQAYRLTRWQEPARLEEVPVPEPGPGEVLVRIGGAGACHSDLHLMDWPEGQLPFGPPFTLGHENAGWVAELGAGVDGLAVDEPVAVYGPWGCGRCRACRASRENYCERHAEIGVFGGGLGRDGGMAPYMLVPSPRLLVPLGDLDPRDAAPLSDSALTPYHAIRRSLDRLRPGTTAVVIGVGGLGQMAVQLLRTLTSARIVSVDTNPAHLDRAGALGSDVQLVPGDDTATEIVELTAGRGAILVLDVVGSTSTLALAARIVTVDGQLTVLGRAGGTLEWTATGVLPWASSLSFTYWGSAIELIEVLDLAREGRIHTDVERFPLADAPAAYAALREGRIRGRAVICPNG